jgi:hypothetical protein
MQAVALVTGDELLVPLITQSIDTEDVLTFIDRLKYDFNLYEKSSYVTFDDQYGVDFAPMFGPSGVCYNFNMIHAHELFHLDM